jgi:hypothetical protein
MRKLKRSVSPSKKKSYYNSNSNLIDKNINNNNNNVTSSNEIISNYESRKNGIKNRLHRLRNEALSNVNLKSNINDMEEMISPRDKSSIEIDKEKYDTFQIIENEGIKYSKDINIFSSEKRIIKLEKLNTRAGSHTDTILKHGKNIQLLSPTNNYNNNNNNNNNNSQLININKLQTIQPNSDNETSIFYSTKDVYEFNSNFNKSCSINDRYFSGLKSKQHYYQVFHELCKRKNILAGGDEELMKLLTETGNYL